MYVLTAIASVVLDISKHPYEKLRTRSTPSNIRRIQSCSTKYMKEQILNLIFPNYNKISSKYILVYPIQKRSEKVDTLSSFTTQQLDGGA